MHSSRMRTTCCLPYAGVSLTETPLDKDLPSLDRDPTGQKLPLDRDSPGQRLPLDRYPPPLFEDKQTPVKTLLSQTSFASGKTYFLTL